MVKFVLRTDFDLSFKLEGSNIDINTKERIIFVKKDGMKYLIPFEHIYLIGIEEKL